MLEGTGGTGQRRDKEEEKNWDNCNSIINKTYLKKEIEYKIILLVL